jgi:hypothetical protein
VAKFQAYGLVYFDAIIRLDGTDPVDKNRVIPTQPALNAEQLTDVIRDAARVTWFATVDHPAHPGGWDIAGKGMGTGRPGGGAAATGRPRRTHRSVDHQRVSEGMGTNRIAEALADMSRRRKILEQAVDSGLTMIEYRTGGTRAGDLPHAWPSS